ncbi:hypothetical protein BH09PAT1_BH09PAT1_4150 [soil metagenome]
MLIIKYLREKSLLSTLSFYHAVLLIITLVNFPYGKYFLGWDALNPEFNFPLNFQRAFSGLWQENYATGVVGGHGFASTLPHTFITYLFSFVLPQNAIRPAFTFFCLYLGGLGMFFLMRRLLGLVAQQERFAKLVEFINYIALLSALFYILNLGTIQIFYVQLETFIVHFAVLPWLFWGTLKILKKVDARSILIYSFISFIGSTQGFIPSLFVAYVVGISAFLLILTLAKRSLSIAIKSFLILILTFVTNAYWLFPLLYFQLTESSIFLNSYNNLSSTLYFIDVNKKFGTLINVALLKGFYFDSYQLGGFILSPWISHLDNVLPLLLGYIFFIVIVTGIIASVTKITDWTTRALIAVFAFFFISLATDMVPLTYLTHLIQRISPTYEQAFRNAFTKFSIGTAFVYSIFFGIGIAFLLQLLSKKSVKTGAICLTIFLLSLLYYGAPAFSGNFLYAKMLITLPPIYSDVMNYFATQPDGRIADFPQECAEGWFSYNWGYFGSGFYWYGIKQPFLARTFDVWSKPNENYYWEITNAIKNQDNTQVDAILRKYNASWILYDPNELYCRNQKGVFLQDDLIKHIKSSPAYKLVNQFEQPGLAPISLYEYTPGKTTSFVKVTTGLPNVGPQYNWNNLDLATTATDYKTSTDQPFTRYYPFRSLFTNRKLEESEFTIDKTDSLITFSESLKPGLAHYTYTSPAYNTLEPSVPLQLTSKQVTGGVQLSAQLLFPYLTLDGMPLGKYQPTIELGTIPLTTKQELSLVVNSAPATKQSDSQYMSTWYFAVPLAIDVMNGKQLIKHIDLSTSPVLAQAMSYQPKVTLPDYSQGLVQLTIPVVRDDQTQGIERFNNLSTLSPEICRDRANNQVRFEVSSDTTPEYIRLHSTDTKQCLTLHFPQALTTYGYLGEIDARSVAGNAPTMSIYSANRLVYNEESLTTTDMIKPFYFILPPTLKNELGYSVQVANDSENSHESTVDFAGMGLWAIPYEFMKNITFAGQHTQPVKTLAPISVEHPTSTNYRVLLHASSTDQTLTLSQTYASGWHAYSVTHSDNSFTKMLQNIFPFLVGNELKNHFLVNNWENGWTAPASTTDQEIVIFFVPQLLQYVGFILLIIPLLLAVIWRFLPLKAKI